MKRCGWATSQILANYHDTEWGVPCFEEKKLFEFLILESAQAGLSWETILKKREGYRKAFAGFDPFTVARFTPAEVDRLLEDSSIVRNRMKIEAAINNAKRFLEIAKEHGSFSEYIWAFVEKEPIINTVISCNELPSKTALSDAISKDMKKQGFRFLGSTIIYAHMQATGMVNDHEQGCFRWQQVQKLARSK